MSTDKPPLTFADNLRRLMHARNATQEDIAAATDVTQGAVSGWLKGAKPSSDKLPQIAKFFDVSIDVLLAQTDVNCSVSKQPLNFPVNLQRLLDGRKLKPAAFARAIGVSHVAVGNWLRGAFPNSSLLLEIAMFFGVTTDELLAEAQKQSPPPLAKSRAEMMIELLRLRNEMQQTVSNIDAWNIHSKRSDERPLPRNGLLFQKIIDRLTAVFASELWAVHVAGPDHVLAAESLEAAETLASELVALGTSWKAEFSHLEEPGSGGILFQARVVPWPFSAEEHAKELAKAREEKRVREEARP